MRNGIRVLLSIVERRDEIWYVVMTRRQWLAASRPGRQSANVLEEVQCERQQVMTTFFWHRLLPL